MYLEEIRSAKPHGHLWGLCGAGRPIRFRDGKHLSGFGYSAGEMIRAINPSLPDLRRNREGMEMSFSLALAEGKDTLTVGYRLRTARGDLRRIEDRTVFHRENETGALFCQSSLVDVTGGGTAEERLEESETRLERVLAEAKVGVWEYYPERDEMQGSGRSTLYGLAMDGPVRRAALWDRIIPSDRPPYRERWQPPSRRDPFSR